MRIKRTQTKIKWVLVSLTFFFAVALALLALANIRISKLECVVNRAPCEELLTERLTVVQGDPLYEAKSKVAGELSGYPAILSFQSRFLPPDKLRVDVITKKPAFAVQKPGSEYFLLAERNGEVVEITKENTLPVVIVEDASFALGEAVSEPILLSAGLLSYLNFMFQERTGRVEGDSFIVDTAPGIRVIFPIYGDPKLLAGTVKYLFSRLNDEGIATKIANVYEIDLRYQNPVLR